MFACHRFWKLRKRHDACSESDAKFLRKHRTNCAKCAQLEQAEMQSLEFLRGHRLDFESDETLDAKILSAVLVQRRSAIGYWAPSAIGAAVAALAVMAILQVITRSDELAPVSVNGSEAKRIVTGTHEFPDWNLHRSRSLDR